MPTAFVCIQHTRGQSLAMMTRQDTDEAPALQDATRLHLGGLLGERVHLVFLADVLTPAYGYVVR